MMRPYGTFILNGKGNPLPLWQPYFVYFYAKHNVSSINLLGMGDFHGNRTINCFNKRFNKL